MYGIYFDFASDRIKEESEPVLSEIAKVLQQNPVWALSVEGHTDSIGGDPYNLDLEAAIGRGEAGAGDTLQDCRRAFADVGLWRLASEGSERYD